MGRCWVKEGLQMPQEILPVLAAVVKTYLFFMLPFFNPDLKEVSLPPSTQMTCQKRSSEEEGQEQLQGHGWAGLETWGSLASKTISG